MKKSGALSSALVLMGLLMSPSLVQATTLVHANLDRLVQEARRIVVARVTAVESKRDEHGLPATYVTLEVGSRLKGEIEDKATVKIFGLQNPLTDGLVHRIPGTPFYRPGQELVLFLIADSPLGFTNTVGLAQGAFYVLDSPEGKIVVNGLGNRGLIRGMTQDPKYQNTPLASALKALEGEQRQGIRFKDFLSLVRSVVAIHGSGAK